MIKPRLFLCSDVDINDFQNEIDSRHVIKLSAYGSDSNVNIKIENVSNALLQNIPPRLWDALEVASYIFAADCSTTRGETWSHDDTMEPWSRDFKFVIPVDDVEFWEHAETTKQLIRMLNFLSSDKYEFKFVKLNQQRQEQRYLQINDDNKWPFDGVDRVFMFSGGLDSLAGAVEAAAKGNKLVLVSHRSVPVIDSRQKQLFAELKSKFNTDMLHIPVWVNKDKKIGKESTQRTRSFLFATLGSIVAEMINANGVSFFENGVVSLNLPVADEVLQSRASKTTHPEVLSMYSKFFKRMLDREFAIDNPYIYKTKADVVEVISGNNAASLIPFTCSCAHSIFKPKTRQHCGSCSQCIDRRIAIISAGQAENDPDIDYDIDVFTGSRADKYETNMAVDYVRHAFELNTLSENEFVAKFNREISQAVKSESDVNQSALRLIELHKRHGAIVKGVIDTKISENISELTSGNLPNSCMLSLIAGGAHRENSWKRYADNIYSILNKGLPATCSTHKPKNEPHLQELCDGILKGNDSRLVREYPFMKWSSSLTKPDASLESLSLWIEYKYIREKTGIRKVTEEIAADITKYGDNDRNVAFIIYDPLHRIIDEHGFSEQIISRRGMLVYFLR